ncbi:hypothetical protein [Phaeodactylibacter luteus]|uniref:Uncharacterized protein n=1 Tax=Phaeodactylibacter luteus TaxID=1564516 RepID=A0A5C6RJH7_9BACT|nr:hypothetical protein [Phaeodactylibacter luteus]TXB62084.1 hypothetical protein FRY97_15715 [Phaeodactylibacter luteus]
MKIPAFSLMLLGLFAFYQGRAQQPLEYCNNRFGFCVEYPVDLHLAKDRPINGDGITLEADAGEIEVVIAGSHNVMEWTPEKIFSFEKAEFEDTYKAPAQELKFQADSQGFEAILSAGGEIEAIRMWSLNGVYVLVSIKGPEAKTARVESLWNSMRVKFSS